MEKNEKDNNNFSQKKMLLPRHASEIKRIYKAAVYSVQSESKGHTKGRQHGYIRLTSGKVREHESIEYLFMGGLSLDGATLSGREGSPSQAASQWEQEREEHSVNRGRRVK